MGKLLAENVLDSIRAPCGPQCPKGSVLWSIAIFTAMELSGSCLTGKKYPSPPESNFESFCLNYMPNKYHKACILLWRLFRNGTAHSYVPKGAAKISSDPTSVESHMTYWDFGLTIYVPKMAQDVTKAIRSYLRDLDKDPVLQKNYHKVLDEWDQEGKERYAEFIKKHALDMRKGHYTSDIIRDIPKPDPLVLV